MPTGNANIQPVLPEVVHASHTRIDGPIKVCGMAPFASDLAFPRMAYAAVVTSPMARGTIRAVDVTRAASVAGFLAAYTYRDFAAVIRPVKHLMAGGYANSSALPLGSDQVHYAGQIVVLVVAESNEAAQQAAARIRVDYAVQPSATTLDGPGRDVLPLQKLHDDFEPPTLGHAAQVFADAAVQVDARYRTPVQHHNPMELFTTTCAWQGGRLTVHEPTRYIGALQHGLAHQLGIPADHVRVICPYIGGHFGSRLALPQYTAPVALAARALGRPVKFVPTRTQCFSLANYRTESRHRLRLGATREGVITALMHDAEAATSRFDAFAMSGTDVTASMYGVANVATSEAVVRLDRNTPGPMRAPPEVPYLFALESAIDELATATGIDPIELRRRNDTMVDRVKGKPFTPRLLMKCLDAGASVFGWNRRMPAPGSMQDGDWLIGMGCAGAVRPAKTAPATMSVAITADGHVTVATAHHEIGNGIYTVLAMEASAQLGVPVDAVTVRLGDSVLPPACLSGGSTTTGSLVAVLGRACEALRKRLASAVTAPGSPLAGIAPDALYLRAGHIQADDRRRVTLAAALAATGARRVEVLADFVPAGSPAHALDDVRAGRLSMSPPGRTLRWVYGAQFAEIRVHAVTCELRVTRLVGAFAPGRVVNRLTAISQLKGGMVWGIGAALLEATEVDPRYGHYVNADLSNYLVPVAADVPDLAALLVEGDDDPALPLKGLGEIGIIGVNAAIANAVHHATGRRIRSLPIRVEQLI